jgi:hypothetical protein
MKETPRRRIAVMSSLYEIFVQISAGKYRVVERWGRCYFASPHPFLKQTDI